MEVYINIKQICSCYTYVIERSFKLQQRSNDKLSFVGRRNYFLNFMFVVRGGGGGRMDDMLVEDDDAELLKVGQE